MENTGLGWDFNLFTVKKCFCCVGFRQRGTKSGYASLLTITPLLLTMKYLEDNLIEARITENTKTSRVTTGNMVAARFDHFTTRELDPELTFTCCCRKCNTDVLMEHTGPVANEKIFNREFLMALYENELAAGLKERDFSITMRNT